MNKNMFITKTVVQGVFVKGEINHSSNSFNLTNVTNQKSNAFAPIPARKFNKADLNGLIDELKSISEKLGDEQ